MQAQIGSKKWNRMAYKQKCLLQLEAYRTHISNKDVVLYNRYYNTLRDNDLVPDTGTVAFTMYYYSSGFRDVMYNTIYDRLKGMIEASRRGDYAFHYQIGRQMVYIWPDEFDIAVNLE